MHGDLWSYFFEARIKRDQKMPDVDANKKKLNSKIWVTAAAKKLYMTYFFEIGTKSTPQVLK